MTSEYCTLGLSIDLQETDTYTAGAAHGPGEVLVVAAISLSAYLKVRR